MPESAPVDETQASEGLFRPTTAHGDYDAIVIGSGIGGLTAAALLARCEGKRVLVLERHFRVGGFTHTFSRPGGFSWDVGVHYVGAEVVLPGLPRDALKVATGGGLRWTRLPDPFERIVFPNFEFAIRARREAFAEDLTREFPAEAKSIQQWFTDVRQVAALAQDIVLRGVLPAPIPWIMSVVRQSSWRLAQLRTQDYIEQRFSDPRLRAIVGARWGDWGLPPSESAFLVHAVITNHYFDGAVYPVGSAASIAKAMTEVIAAAGGKVRVRAEVERILMRRGRAVGVRLCGGEEITAPWIISDAGARNTYLRLVPEDVHVPFRDTLRRLPGSSMVVLYLGLSRSPSELGAAGENYWLYNELDHRNMWDARARIGEGDVRHGYLSFPSAKDPEARGHTAEIGAAATPGAFAQFHRTSWMKRGDEYAAVKARIADGLLRLAERRLPGLTALVQHRELSTPLTSEHFTAHVGGEIYGIPWTPERVKFGWLSARSPIPGLCLTGADAAMLGVAGAAMGGMAAAARVAGLGVVRRMTKAAKAISDPVVVAPTPAVASRAALEGDSSSRALRNTGQEPPRGDAYCRSM